MASLQDILTLFILNGLNNNFNINYDSDDEQLIMNSEETLKLHYICFDTSNIKKKIKYSQFIEEFKKFQIDKFENKINKIIDVTNDYTKYNFYNFNDNKSSYNNILYEIKNYYICELTKININFFNVIIDMPNNSYLGNILIFNMCNIYIVNSKNKIEKIITELENSIEENSIKSNIINYEEFNTFINKYSIDNDKSIIDLTEKIKKISIDSKIDMKKTFIYNTANKTTKKYLKYIKDIDEIMSGLDKTITYICNTTIETYYFIVQLLSNKILAYNNNFYPIQNGIFILSPQNNLYIYDIKNFSGINTTRINILLENIFNKKIIECCICYKKSKKNNICYNCFQFNGCIQCGKKLIAKNSTECVLCKS